MARSYLMGLAFAAWAIVFASPGQAQFPMPGLGEAPGPFVRDAFDAPYGRALISEFGNALRAAADPGCLQSKGIRPDELTSRGGALWMKWGTRAMETILAFIDMPKYAEAFAAAAGPGAAIEFEQLRKHPEVARYIAVERPVRLAKVADFVVEQFDRYAVLTRLNVRNVSPISTGNDALLNANPTERIEDELDKLATMAKSMELPRFLELADHTTDALTAAIRKDQMLLVGPSTFYRGVEADLAEFCVGQR